MTFAGKVVLITGAAGGIGKETARLFAKQGAKLALVDLNQIALEALARELELEDYLIQAVDVSNEQQVKDVVQLTKQKYGKIDVFFNNAGIEGDIASITETTEEQLDKVLNVNVKGVFFGLKYVMATMIEQGFGNIVNTSSIMGLNGAVDMSPYVASKHAVIGLTKAAALESAANGVRVNAICPGYINTRMMRDIEGGKVPENPNLVKDRLRAQSPMNRYGEASEVAEFVLFLSSDNASYINGNYYVIDGGVSASP